MKRTLKILAVVLSVLLVVAGVMLAASAQDSTQTRTGNTTGFDYIDKETGEAVMTTDLQEAFYNAARDSTIYLNNPGGETVVYNMPTNAQTGAGVPLRVPYYYSAGVTGRTYNEDTGVWSTVTVEADATVPTGNHGGPFTLDLGGNTLLMVQTDGRSYISLESANALTVTNGALHVGKKESSTVFNNAVQAYDYFTSVTGATVNNTQRQWGTESTSTYVMQSLSTAAGTAPTLSSSNVTYKTSLFGSSTNATVDITAISGDNPQTYAVYKVDTATAAPLFKTNWGYSGLVLDGVDTYSGGMVFLDSARTDGTQVCVYGGNHYVVTSPMGNYAGAFIDSRSNMFFTAEGATFYVDKDCTLISSASYAKGEESYESVSSFELTQCNIIADYINTNLVKYANDVTDITFNECKIYGSINPTRMSEDEGFAGSPTAANVVLGHGTMWASTGTAFGGVATESTMQNTNAIGNAIAVNGATSKTLTSTCDYYYQESWSYTKTTLTVSTLVNNYYGYEQIWEQTDEAHTATAGASATIVAAYPLADTNNLNLETGLAQTLSVSNIPSSTDVTSGSNAVYSISSDAVTYTFDSRVTIKSAFEILDASGNHVDWSADSENVPYGTDLATVFDTVPDGGTLKLISDWVEYTIDKVAAASVSSQKTMTIDLNGYMFLLRQDDDLSTDALAEGYIHIQTNATLTVKDSSADKTGILAARQIKTPNSAYPFFQVSNGYNLILDDITTYLGSLMYAWGGAGNVTINGGTHYAVFAASGCAGGFISVADNVNFVANDATFFVGGYGSLIGSASPRATEVKKSTFTYNGCIIIGENVGDVTQAPVGLIGNFNEYSEVYFNDSYVYGLFDEFSKFDQDATAEGVQPNSIRIGTGTVYVKEHIATAPTDVIVPTRGILTDILDADGASTTESITVTLNLLKSSNAIKPSFQTTEYTKTYTFDGTVDTKKVFEVLDQNGSFLQYIEEDVELGVATKKTFAQAISEVMALDGEGHTLKLLSDYEVDITNIDEYVNYGGSGDAVIAKITEAVTVDLDGREFIFYQGTSDTSATKNYQQTIDLTSSAANVTFKNGDIKVHNNGGATYAIFRYSAAGSSVTLDNVNTYSGSIVYAYDYSGVNLTINGGEHYATRQSRGTQGNALITLRGKSAAVTANDASFFVSDSANSLISISSATQNTLTENTVITFNGCNVIANSISKNLVGTMNGGTTLYFNGCKLYGGINPKERAVTKVDDAVSNPIENGSVIMGHYNGAATVWMAEGAAIRDYLIAPESTTYAISAQDSSASITTYYLYNGVELNSGLDPFSVKKVISTVSFDTTIVELSTDLTYDTTDVSNGDNGWYALDYTGSWYSDDGVNYLPEVVVTPYLSAASYNLALNGKINPTIYLPAALPEGITVNKVALEDGTALSGTVVDIYSDISNYEQYTAYDLGGISPTALSTTLKVLVTYTVVLPENENGISEGTYQITQTIKVTPTSYAQQLLSSDAEDTYGAKPLVANMLKYCTTVMSWQGVEDATVTDLYNTYSGYCIDVDTATFTDGEKGDWETTLADYVESVTYVINADNGFQPQLQITLKSGYSLESLTIEGWVSGQDAYNWGDVDYAYTVNGSVVTTNEIATYNIDQMVTITVNGVSGTYSMNDYYTSVAGSDEQTAELLAVLRSYSRATADYRFGPKKEA